MNTKPAANDDFEVSECLNETGEIQKKEGKMYKTTTKIPLERVWIVGPPTGLISGMEVENACGGSMVVAFSC